MFFFSLQTCINKFYFFFFERNTQNADLSGVLFISISHSIVRKWFEAMAWNAAEKNCGTLEMNTDKIVLNWFIFYYLFCLVYLSNQFITWMAWYLSKLSEYSMLVLIMFCNALYKYIWFYNVNEKKEENMYTKYRARFGCDRIVLMLNKIKENPHVNMWIDEWVNRIRNRFSLQY